MPGIRPTTAARAVAAAEALDPARFDEAALKGQAVGEAASLVSAIPEVRAALLAFQRSFGRAPPGAVLDGRDIGTVVFPDADVKIFVTATAGGARPPADGRAAGGRRRRSTRRTCSPTSCAGTSATRTRAAAPLKPAADAHLLDTTTRHRGRGRGRSPAAHRR